MARENNAFNMRRFANIFSPQQEDPLMGAYRKINFNGAPQAPEPSAPTSEEADPILQALKRMQGGQASTAYREHLGNQPKREDYQPSQTRRLGGALAAAAASFNNLGQGLAVGEQIVGAPYRTALEDWKLKGAGLGEQADMEQQDSRSQLDYMKAVRQAQIDKEKSALETRKVDIDEFGADTTRLYREAQIRDMQTKGYERRVGADGNEELVKVMPNGEVDRIPLGPSMAGRQAANAERGTDIQAFNAQTGRGQLGVAQGNLGMRGEEFNYRMGQDEILNQDRATGRGIQQQNTDIARQNAGAAGFVPAGEQYGAEAMATGEALKVNPDWRGWVNDDGSIKKPGDYWGGGPSSGDPNYRAFLQAVEQAKQRILSTRRPGVGSVPGGRVQSPNLGGMGTGPLKFSDLPDR